ncbi:cytochrome-c peroxidase [Paraburkholderia humisilvae]|uniref:Methylamine utilization protein MauG n=1 Tax=Paraburkholderia humisilvae TaxID=627669 RepID=A0A6J5D4D8_9BURK|nr:cytochrome c peroxidase [Paraburkholderia humisilvae]CAB3749058.1 Methylamine utilization protein MauG [Paraburkholderia humisilvae]
MRIALLAGVVAAALVVAACGGDNNNGQQQSASAPGAASAPSATPQLSLAAQVGAKMFFDKTLSGSGKISCATCHNPDFAYGPPNGLAVQLGGVDDNTPGVRAVPSLRYKEFTPPYSDLLDNPDGVTPPGPGGGFTWDGRANSLADQAKIPLLSTYEMANRSPDAVVNTLKAGPYAALFKQAFGENAFADSAKAFTMAMSALQSYQQEDPSFHPYTSKFDLLRHNRGNYLTPQEMHGLQLFNDENKGNCIACHLSGNAQGGSVAPFTDYSFEAVAPPRNMEIPANADPTHVDMGLCQAAATGHTPANSAKFCGMFKTPTLRNVATRQSFFHNGVFHTLRDVVEFYNKRDTNPELFYSKAADGSVNVYDDLPVQYQPNIDMTVPVVHTRGAAPSMTEQEVDDLVAFLGALTDDFQPPSK